MSKGKLHCVSCTLEKRRAALFLGLSMGWDVADAFEGEGLLADLKVSKSDVCQGMHLAKFKRRLLGPSRRSKGSVVHSFTT